MSGVGVVLEPQYFTRKLTQIGWYRVFLYRDQLQQVVSPSDPPPTVAHIECETVDADLVRINFVPTGSKVPSSRTQPYYPGAGFVGEAWYATIWAPSDEFAWYLDILRNERRVYASIITPGIQLTAGVQPRVLRAPPAPEPQNSLETEGVRSGWGHVRTS